MTTIIGASAMIGIVCEATIQGISERSSTRTDDDRHRQADAERRADEKADQRLLQGDARMKDEAALGGRRRLEDELVEFGDDLMRRR